MGQFKKFIFVAIAISVSFNLVNVFASENLTVKHIYIQTKPGVDGHVAYTDLEEIFVTKNPKGDNLYLLFPDHRVYVKSVFRIVKEHGKYVVTTRQGHQKFEQMIGHVFSDSTTVSGTWVNE